MVNPQPPVPGSPQATEVVTREVAADSVSPKVTWAAAASALATITWTLVAALAPHSFTTAEIATLTGASASVLAFLGGYFVRDKLRHQP
jgi:hypothetical protein